MAHAHLSETESTVTDRALRPEKQRSFEPDTVLRTTSAPSAGTSPNRAFVRRSKPALRLLWLA